MAMEETRRHPITNVILNAPFPHIVTSILIGVMTYLGFLIIAFLTGQLDSILFTVMHLIQIDFSITIIIGLYFLDIFYRTFEKKFGEMRSSFVMDFSSLSVAADNLVLLRNRLNSLNVLQTSS